MKELRELQVRSMWRELPSRTGVVNVAATGMGSEMPVDSMMM
jgi:hypothetical protein